MEKFTKQLENYDKQIHKLAEDINKLYSPIIATAKERKHKITRNGKEVEVREDALWYELRNLGLESEAGKFLYEKYKEILDLDIKHKNLVKEMEDYCIKEVGINPLQMSILDIIKLIKMFK